MCGIAGIIDFRGRPIDEDVLQAFCRSLGHRGPDDRGIWRHQADGFSAGLAHTRLAVIDPTPDGHQPMLDADGSRVVAYNGELYNHREMARELHAPLRTACDTEAVLQACAAWGPDTLARFDGMWALAYVDVEARTGHLSRDPFGIKPLYYAAYDGRLVFASELAALRVIPDLPTEIDDEAIAAFLNVGYIPHPQTIYRGVRKLSPGHLLRFNAAGVDKPQRYHRISPPPKQPGSFEDGARMLRDTVTDAVTRQQIADVPLGAFLSGGLDSSIVVACLAEHASQPIETFSIGYADHPRYDETEHAETVARHFGTKHHAFKLTFNDVLETVEPMLSHLGEPFADSSLLPTALVSHHTRRHVTVALSGDGGDELFGGYWRYLGHHYLARWHRLPAFLRKGLIEPLLRVLPSARSNRRLDRLRQACKLLRGDCPDPIDRHLAWSRFMNEPTADQLIGLARNHAAMRQLKEMYERAPEDLTHAASGPDHAETGSSADGLAASSAPLARILLGDLAVSLPGDMLHKVDLASMHHSLEVRVPLLAPDVVNLATAMPIDWRIRGTTGKYILREAFRDVLPESILTRKKMGFEVPVGEFLRNELREMYADLVTPTVLQDLDLDAAAAERLRDDHLSRRHDHTETLWSLLTLCHWHNR